MGAGGASGSRGGSWQQHGAYLEGVWAAQKPHGSWRGVGRAVPALLGTAAGAGMARNDVPQHRLGGWPAAPCPAQHRPRSGRAAGLSRIGSQWAPAGRGWGPGRGTPSSSEGGGGMKPAGGRAEVCESEAGSQAECKVLTEYLLCPLYLIPSLFT